MDRERLLGTIKKTYKELQQLETHRNALYQDDKNAREISKPHFEAQLSYLKKAVELMAYLRIYNENFDNELGELEKAVDDSLILLEEGLVHIADPLFNLKDILIEFEKLREVAKKIS